MAIEWQILGQAGADNALFVTIDSGQSRESLLFDCGEGCLRDLRTGAIQSVSHLFFSHFHMDHVAGFDTFFRHNYNRPEGPVQVWGPPGAIELMWHRFRSFGWNLHVDQPGEWIVREVDDVRVAMARFITAEAFAIRHPQPDQALDPVITFQAATWHLETRLLPHGSIPSLASRVVEKAKRNIDPAAMHALGLVPGPWLKELTNDSVADATPVRVSGRPFTFGALRSSLLLTTPGDSIAYLTDFRVEPGSPLWADLVHWLTGTTTLVCECQYRAADDTLARRHGHMTADLVGRLAAEASVGSVVLQHLSRRYSNDDWTAMRHEAKAFFPRIEFPAGWIPGN
jgi:ribonuclease Z